MFYSRLSTLCLPLTAAQLEQLDSYFASLSDYAKTAITVSKVSSALNIDYKLASQILKLGVTNDFLKLSYAIRCPSCGMIIKNVSNPTQIGSSEMSCYACDDVVEITVEDIEVMYEILDPLSPFGGGQHDNAQANSSSKRVATIDSLKYLLDDGFDLNLLIYKPTDMQYAEMKKIYDSVFVDNKVAVAKGFSLEKLIIYLFNLCKPSIVANGLRTKTNQIDCFCVNKLFVPYGVLEKIGLQFIVECKNEKKTPAGDYMSKIHSIITLVNAGNQDAIKFGMIVSKKPGPKTFIKLSNQYYLSSKIIIIAMSTNDLIAIVKDKCNFLEMIQRKITEVEMNATTDLKKAGLFNS